VQLPTTKFTRDDPHGGSVSPVVAPASRPVSASSGDARRSRLPAARLAKARPPAHVALW
jgi:hypothetical protein